MLELLGLLGEAVRSCVSLEAVCEQSLAFVGLVAKNTVAIRSESLEKTQDDGVLLVFHDGSLGGDIQPPTEFLLGGGDASFPWRRGSLMRLVSLRTDHVYKKSADESRADATVRSRGVELVHKA